jgi:ribonucrease Y
MFFIGLALGGGIGTLSLYLAYRFKKGSVDKLAQEILQRAESQAYQARLDLEFQLKQKEFEHRASLERASEQKMQKLSQREEKLDRQLALFEKKVHEAEKKEKELERLQKKVAHDEREVEKLKNESLTELQSLSGLSTDHAKERLFTRFTEEIKQEGTALLAKKKQEIEEEAERYAVSVITTAINRLSLPTLSEVALITVALPSHEMKGRVIGREGRNIRALEQATGVNFVIDDTPNAVVISGFDPIRKEIARMTLKELIQDGRIHPTRIEEVVAKAEEKIEEQIKGYGKEAALQAGSLIFHPEVIHSLGKLHFLYNCGQNLLSHSLEVSHLMGIMASELQLDCERAKRIGLLHDIGKAISQEIEGSHALIGQQFALKYGENEEIANGIGCHHDEIPPLTMEASLCSAANKISKGRLGARSEALEYYLKRSSKLEQLARQFEGVEKAYAMHAGREVRVMVEPDRFDDHATLHLAREIAKKIEKELSYSGNIKVTVIREKRVVEYAC